MRRQTALPICLALGITACTAPARAAPWRTDILWHFAHPKEAYPQGLIADAAGNLYGVASANAQSSGVIFRLAPPRSGTAWQLTTLYQFAKASARDASAPSGSLVIDAAGNLYGTTERGGADDGGTVFRLSPPGPGQSRWTETLLYSFSLTNDGYGPANVTLALGGSGNLYGTTRAGGAHGTGTIFKLAPPPAGSPAWVKTTIYDFGAAGAGALPYAGLVRDYLGRLYGTTLQGGAPGTCSGVGCGTVFQLMPPAAGLLNWTYTTLYAFTGARDGQGPASQLLLHDGNLYGTSSAGAFQLSPPAQSGPWTLTPLGGVFSLGALTIDSAGDLYGAAYTGRAAFGSVFEIFPPAAGRASWAEETLLVFPTSTGPRPHPLGAYPLAGVILGPKGVLFGTANEGGDTSCTAGCGTIFSLTKR